MHRNKTTQKGAMKNANTKTKKMKGEGGKSCSPPSKDNGEVNTNMTHKMQTQK
jgi:hypothetical protein